MSIRQSPRIARAAIALFVAVIAIAHIDARQFTASIDRTPPPLRIVDRSLMDVVREGTERSTTLRSLVAHLQDSHAIVYVSLVTLPHCTAGLTHFMATSGGWWYLSVELDGKLQPMDLIATLAHELQHVTEIVDARTVKDDASMLELYRRIGNESSQFQTPVRSFETDTAITVGRQVYGEVFGSR